MKPSLIFPTQKSVLACRDMTELKQTLLAEQKAVVDDPKQSGYFRVTCNRIGTSLYVQAKCRFCPCSLAWKSAEDQVLVLTKFDNVHYHEESKDCKRQKIFQYFREHPELVMERQVNYLSTKFAISVSYCKTLIKNFRKGSTESFNELRKKYSQPNNLYCQWPTTLRQDEVPHAILIITEEMKKLYQKCGSFVKLDFRYGIVEERVEEIQEEEGQGEEEGGDQERDGGRGWGNQQEESGIGVGFISGVNSQGKVVIFGICTCPNRNKQYIHEILKIFFNYMGSESQSIITDQDRELIRAIKELNQNFFNREVYHIYDSFHVARNIKLRTQKSHEYITEMLNTSLNSRYQQLKQKLHSETPESQQSHLTKFLSLSPRCCISQIPPVFTGLSCSTQSTMMINQMITKGVKGKVNLSRLLPTLQYFCNRINYRSTAVFARIARHEMENGLRVPGLDACQEKLPQIAFKRVLKNIEESARVKLISKDVEEKKARVQDGETVFELDLISEKWECLCKYAVKTHLPCPHEILAADDLWRQVRAFWKQ